MMRRAYEAPQLFIDEFAADTMIASNETGTAELTDWQKKGGIGTSPKNNNADNNQNCWGCRDMSGYPDPSNPENACMGVYWPKDDSIC